MNDTKYSCPFQDGVGKGPHISVCTNSNASTALYAPDFLDLVCLPLMHATQLSILVKSMGLRIPSDTKRLTLFIEM